MSQIHPSKNQKPLVKEMLSKASIIGDHCRRKEVEVDIEGLGLTKVTKIETCNVSYGLLLLLMLILGRYWDILPRTSHVVHMDIDIVCGLWTHIHYPVSTAENHNQHPL